MGWVYLILGIIAEVLGSTSMKISEGFTKLIPSIMIFVFYGLSLILVTLSLKSIEVGVAYAIWAGLGVAIITFISIFLFQESFNLMKAISILLIIAGVIGLNLSGEKSKPETQLHHVKMEREA
ncbi:DMT family transporter [Bacillus salipaludis]|uniref:DMT family transporter n=1 Tax=Bacillus salipaludis TaxID=2547811 RepID=A0ABW8RKZ2_9BACI